MADQKPDDPKQNEQPDEVLSLHDDLDGDNAAGNDHDEQYDRDTAAAPSLDAQSDDDHTPPSPTTSETPMSEPQLPVTTTVVKRGGFTSALALLLSLLALAASGYVWWLQQNMSPVAGTAAVADPEHTRALVDAAAQNLRQQVGATDTALRRLNSDLAALTEQVDTLASQPLAAAAEAADEADMRPDALMGDEDDAPAIVEPPQIQVPAQTPALLADLNTDPQAAADAEAMAAAVAAQNEQTLAALAAIDALQSRLGSLESSQAEQVDELSRIEQDIADAMEQAQQADQDIEQAIESANTDNRAARREWLLAETEYLLQTANTALQMANDPNAALAALRGADERLQSLADPGLTATREVLSDEIAALEALPRPDIQGIALTLGSLAARVELLPLVAGAEERYDEAGSGEAPQEPGWRRAAGAFKSALGGMVSVQKDDADIAPLLAPQQRFFLYRNLELQLESARLAALRADNANYSESLSAATRWLNNRFDVSQPAVGSALATLEELAQTDVAPERPNIAGSLSALREVTTP